MVRGTLHVFIIDLERLGRPPVDIGEEPDGTKISRISGQICGRIEFLFFTIEGCVESFSLGDPAFSPALLWSPRSS